MNRKAFMATTVIFVLLAVGLQPINITYAASNVLAEPPIIVMQSPENKTYNTNSLTLSFNVTTGNAIDPYIMQEPDFLEALSISEVSYKSDWQKNKTILYEDTPFNKKLKVLTFFINLEEVPEGNHSLLIQGTEMLPDPYFFLMPTRYTSSVFVSFIIDTIPPSISKLSIENRTYHSSEIPLSFSVDDSTSWIGYSLDNQTNVTITGDSTLGGLAEGNHSIVIYANDRAGNMGKSETIFFNIALPTPVRHLLQQ